MVSQFFPKTIITVFKPGVITQGSIYWTHMAYKACKSFQLTSSHAHQPCCLAIVGIYLGLRFWGKPWVCIFKTLRFCHFLSWFYPKLFRDEPKKMETAGGSRSWSSSSSLLTGRWAKGRRDRMRGREEGQVYLWKLRKNLRVTGHVGPLGRCGTGGDSHGVTENETPSLFSWGWFASWVRHLSWL